MAINSGPADEVSDVNDRRNVTGAGINMAPIAADDGAVAQERRFMRSAPASQSSALHSCAFDIKGHFWYIAVTKRF